jgi:hypothetical protein
MTHKPVVDPLGSTTGFFCWCVNRRTRLKTCSGVQSPRPGTPDEDQRPEDRAHWSARCVNPLRRVRRFDVLLLSPCGLRPRWLWPQSTRIFGRRPSGRTRRSALPPRGLRSLSTRVFERMSSRGRTRRFPLPERLHRERRPVAVAADSRYGRRSRTPCGRLNSVLISPSVSG